ncbi:MAG: replicative DNA helicase [Gammaproteobacteria bacterium]|nr:replicative DNA helicase [Gammaproteobacteria bacterium]
MNEVTIEVAGDPFAARLPKLPPQSVEAEQALLGGLLLSNEAWDNVADRVSESDFYQKEHRLIFRAIGELAEADRPRDVVTLSEQLDTTGQLEEAGGLAYLGRLAQDTPGAANITAYADIVRERSVLRQLIVVGNEIANSAYHPEGQDSDALLDTAEAKVFGIADQKSRGQQGFKNIKQILTAAVDRIDELFTNQNPVTGLSTGFHDLDDKTSGLQNADLIIVAGRPSMGKTAFAMNLAEHTAIDQDSPVAFFSMEMPGEQLAMRLIASLGRIDLHKLRSGQLVETDWHRITSAMSLLSHKANLYIDDSPALTPIELRARARRLKRERGLGLIVVDYLQLMQVPGTKENRATEISEISRSMKALAKELNVPIIALSQLNRSLEQRTDKRPIMADLRESGAIEQDADVIIFVYRDEVYNEDSNDKGTAEIIISKQRNGPIGKVRLTFLGSYTKFENFSPEVFAGRGDNYDT